MAGTIKLPLIGTVKTGWAVAGGGIVLGIVGFAYYRHRQNAGASSASPAADTGTSSDIDPQTGYPYGSAQDTAALAGTGGATSEIDPETGFPYGSAEDTAALAQEESGAGFASEGGGGLGGFDELLPGGTGTSTTSTSNTGPGTFTSNAYWIAYCEETVTGYSQSQIQGALSAAEARIKVTPTQLAIYQACLAIGGPPPTPIPTPQLKSTGTPGKSTKIKVPDVHGMPYDDAARVLEAAGLKARRGQADVGTVTSESPAIGHEVDKGSTVTLKGTGRQTPNINHGKNGVTEHPQ